MLEQDIRPIMTVPTNAAPTMVGRGGLDMAGGSHAVL